MALKIPAASDTIEAERRGKDTLGQRAARPQTSCKIVQLTETSAQPVSSPASAAKFDRNAYHKDYMREYMRAYRKRQKEKQK